MTPLRGVTFASLRSLLFLVSGSERAEPALRVEHPATAGTTLTGHGAGDAAACGL